MSYRVNIFIDAKTSCLIDRATSLSVETTYKKVAASDLKGLKKQGWSFDWTTPIRKGFDAYGLTVKDNEKLQGLIALKPSQELGAVLVDIVESAPHNVGSQGQYEGVGAHLFAIAARTSFEQGHDGFVVFEAKTKLIDHYEKELGAERVGKSHRMVIKTSVAEALIKKYFSGEDNE